MKLRETLAVVDDDFFYVGTQRVPHGGPNMLLLLKCAEEMKLTHVWIAPNTDLYRRLSKPVDLAGWHKTEMLNRRKTIVSYGSYIRQGKKGPDRIQVGFTTSWPWAVQNARQLHQTIFYLENTLGLNLEWTPAHMAIEVIRQKNADRWSWLAPLTVDLVKECPIPGFTIGSVDQTLTDKIFSQKPGRYHVKLDGNSNYGAAMTGLRVGEGDPIWQDNARLYDGLKPGFWHVKCEKVNSIFDGLQLPSFEDREWATTDLIQQFRAVGYYVTINGGWVWEKYHQTLRSTVSNREKTGLWDLRLAWRARRKESPAHENVYNSISAILHTVHGKLGDSDLYQRRFYRPDIYAMVVSAALARILYRVTKIYLQFNVLPRRIHIDGLEYDVDDPRLFDSIVDADKLGGLKLVAVTEIQPVS